MQHAMVVPNLVQNLFWGPRVFSWSHDLKLRDRHLLPFVKWLHGVAILEGAIPPNMTQLTYIGYRFAEGVLPVSMPA